MLHVCNALGDLGFPGAGVGRTPEFVVKDFNKKCMTMKESLFFTTSHSADFLPNLQKYTWFKFLEYYNFIKQLISRAKWTPPTMTTTTVTLKMAISWHSRNWKLTIITKMALWHWVSSQSGIAKYSGCVRFPDILQSCVVHQVLGESVYNSFSCFYTEIAYSDFTFCGAYRLSFLVFHTISTKRAHPCKDCC